jgi:hypothetical protein
MGPGTLPRVKNKIKDIPTIPKWISVSLNERFVVLSIPAKRSDIFTSV